MATKQTRSEAADSQNGEPQSIELLQKRYGDLNTKRIQADANLQNAEKQLATLRAEALEKYGTHDLAELRQKLADMTAENETKRREYQASLDQIERSLAEVEQKFAAAEAQDAEKAK
jgi:hypothetical protein